ncbi:MAG: glycosyltransferase family 2 protein, partial [Halomonas sp.]
IVFSPMGAAGQFRLKRFRFVWLTPTFAYNRLLRRLSNNHDHYRDLPLPEVRKSLKQQAIKQGRKWQAIALEDYETTVKHSSVQRHYQKWIRLVEDSRTPSRSDLTLHAFKNRFNCSVILLSSSYDGLSDHQFKALLDQSLASLAEQSLSPHQVLLLLSSARQASLQGWLAEWQRELSGLCVVESDVSTLYAQRSDALTYCENTWVWFLRPGDRLAPSALYYAATIAEGNQNAKLLVADEDFVDDQGVRHSPQFKPDWNPDLLLSMPYSGRAVCYQHALISRLWETVGWLNAPQNVDESNNADWLDYAQLLGVVRLGDFSREWLAHVPQVAYHGRPSEIANSFVPLVQQHLDSLNVDAQVSEGLMPATQRVRWPMPTPKPLVSLLVPTRDGVDILRPCVDAILDRTDYSHFEVLILDNQSSCAATLAYLQEVEVRDPRVKVLRWNMPFNYSAINNFGAANAKGSIIGLINNDVEPMEGTWLTEMVEQVSRPDIGCVGAKLFYPNDTVQHGGVILGLGGLAGHAHRFFQRDEEGYMGRLKVTQNLSAVTAACLLLRKAVFDEVNGLNETDLAVAYNDVDLCMKVREAGYRNLWTPYAALYHHESVSRGADDTPDKRARWLSEYAYMRKTWGELLDSDPAYNPNLTLVHEDFSLR